MKVVHCILDDKFLDAPIKQFGSLEGVSNEWYCLNRSIRSPKKNFKWIKSPLPRIVSCGYFLERCKDRGFCDVIILHSLYALPFYIIPKIHPDIKVVWFAWGFDLYSNKWPARPLIPVDKFKPLTKKLLESEKKSFKSYLFLFKTWVDPRISYRLFKKSVHRIDYFSGVFPIEYDLLRNCRFFRARRVDFNYVNSDPEIWSLNRIYADEICNDGQNVQIGNSASDITCHLDLFEVLKGMNLTGRKLIVPLSYGGTERYIDAVCSRGSELYGDHFVPLKDFLPYREYNEILKSCGSAIFYDEQQGSVGNIMSVIWNGGKVFLSKTSLNYIYLKSIGLTVFTIQDQLTPGNIERSLSREEVLTNRKIISERYSYDQTVVKIGKLVETIGSDLKNLSYDSKD